MKEQIIQLFTQHSRSNAIVFFPEIKVRRKNDILFIYELHSTKFTNSVINYHVILEVGTTERTRVPLGMLDDLSICAIYMRLKGMGKPIEKIA
jgi:hypothetical protein